MGVELNLASRGLNLAERWAGRSAEVVTDKLVDTLFPGTIDVLDKKFTSHFTQAVTPSLEKEAAEPWHFVTGEDFANRAHELKQLYPGSLPSEFLQDGLEPHVLLKQLDTIADRLRPLDPFHKPIEVPFGQPNQTAVLTPLGSHADANKGEGNYEGKGYQFSFQGHSVFFKVFHQVIDDFHNFHKDLAMGTHYLAYQPFNDHYSFICGSVDHGWTFDELLKPDASALTRPGRSWKEHCTQYFINEGDHHPQNLTNPPDSNPFARVRFDRGGESFSLMTTKKVTFPEFEALLSHANPKIRAQSPQLIHLLSDPKERLLAFELAIKQPESRQRAIEHALSTLDDEDLQTGIRKASAYPDTQASLQETLALLRTMPRFAGKQDPLEEPCLSPAATAHRG